MGCNVLMDKQQGKVIVIAVCLWLLSINGAAQTARRSLLLVCSENSTISSLSNSDARKLFLGIPTVIGGMRLKPLLNESDPLISEVFLQKTIFMSKQEYERQLLSRVFRFGGSRPPVYKDIDELMKELNKSPGSVTYMWSDQVENSNGLKSIGKIWADSGK